MSILLTLADPRVRLGLNAAMAVLLLVVIFGAIIPAPAAVLFIGVVYGSISALFAMGIVLVYRANRIINFAAGEIGAVAGLLAALLQAGPRWGYVPSTIAGLAAAIAIGGLVEVLLVRRFASAPRLILTVATLGIAQLLIFAELFLPGLFGSKLVLFQVASPFSFTFDWHPVVFEGGHVAAVIVAAVLGVGLWVFLQRSSYGIAVRAAAESRDRAAQLGVPTRRLGTLVWCIAAGLAGAAALLRGPLIGVSLGTVLGPALLLRALAAAVLGRMESLSRTFAAAVLLGVVEQAVIWHSGHPVVVDAVLFAVIVVGLLAQRRRPSRAGEPDASSWDLVGRARPTAPEVKRLPRVRTAQALLLGAAVVLAVVVPVFLSPSRVNLVAAGMILAMVVLSLTVLTGWAGQISLGQMAFVGFGAATAAKLASLGWDFFACLLAAGVVGALASLVVGIPALRVRGPFLAVASFAFALASSSYFLNQEFFPSLIVTDRVVRPEILGKFNLEHEHAYYFVVLALLVTTLLSLRSLRTSRTGRVLMAARDNPAAAQVYGVDVLRARLTGFAISGFVAAVAGGALAFHQHTLGVDQYRPERSLEVFTLAIFGGIGSLAGAVASAAYYTTLSYFVSSTVAVLFVTAVGLLAILLALPGGLGQILLAIRDAAVRLLVSNEVSRPAVAPEGRPGLDRHTPAGRHDPEVLLSIRDLDVAYGHVQVLFGVDVDIRRGEVVALVGTNGAGKSTLLNAVVGSVRATSGTVHFAGRSLRGTTPDQNAARGLALAPGGRGVFPGLTVDEHLLLAGWLFRGDAPRIAAATTRALGRFPGLADRRRLKARDLSGGEQQMLVLAQALMSDPELLMVDELSLGLAPMVVEELAGVVKQIAAEGTTVVLVDQSLDLAVSLARRALFMEKGEIRYDGPAAALRKRTDLVRSVFLQDGRPAAPARRGLPTNGQQVLEVEDVRVRFGGVTAVAGVSLEVGAGQIVGLIGANGAGKTTIFDVVSGFIRPDEGRVQLTGRDVTALTPDRRARLGLGRSFQACRLFPSLTVSETIAVALERHVESRSAIAAMIAAPPQRADEERLAARVAELIDSLNLGDYATSLISELSTGTRRVVDLACALAHEPVVLLLDEPSAGIAQREVEALAPLLLDVRDRTGSALVVIEHDIALAGAIADELVALDRGEIIARGTPSDVLADAVVIARYLGSAPGRRRRAAGRLSR